MTKGKEMAASYIKICTFIYYLESELIGKDNCIM